MNGISAMIAAKMIKRSKDAAFFEANIRGNNKNQIAIYKPTYQKQIENNMNTNNNQTHKNTHTKEETNTNINKEMKQEEHHTG